MPEAAAIGLSNDPRVLYVEEDGIGTLLQGTQQPPLPWGLDRIDQIGAVDTNPPPNGLTNGTYTYPNDGTGVHVYVIDTGILASHHQFQNSDGTSRVSLAVDTTGGNGTPCNGHGTLVASIAGGNPPPAYPSEISYGAAKGVTLHSVRSARDPDPNNCAGGDADDTQMINGIYWVANNASKPAVANISVGCHFNTLCNDAADAASAVGVTVVVASGNENTDVTQDPKSTCPATAPSVITVGGSNAGESKYAGSDWGGRIDIFGPASTVPGAYIPNDFSTTVTNGNSLAAPHVVGVVAMYLHDHPTGTASLPSIVRQVIKSNADTCDWQGIQNSTCVKINNRHPEAGTADRLLYSSFLQAPANPIYNQRFFVWQQYADFTPRNAQTGQPQSEPDEAGLDYWTRNNITANCYTVTTSNILAHVNDNSPCTEGWRANTSLAFWVDSSSPQGSHPGWLSSNGALSGVDDLTFIKECYKIYQKRTVTNDPNDPNYDSGVDFWVHDMQCYNHSPACNNDPSDAAGVQHIIDAFLVSWDYELRFGPHS